MVFNGHAVNHYLKLSVTIASVHQRWSDKGRKRHADAQRNIRADARGEMRLGKAGNRQS